MLSGLQRADHIGFSLRGARDGCHRTGVFRCMCPIGLHLQPCCLQPCRKQRQSRDCFKARAQRGAKIPPPVARDPAATSYIPLIITNTVLALGSALYPMQAADTLFGAGDYDTNSAVIPLMRLVSAGFTSAAFVSVALKKALEDKPISRTKFVRLNLGLSVFATVNLLVLVTSLVDPDGSIDYPGRPGFWLAVISYINTLTVSWGKYGKSPNLPETVKETVPSLKIVKKTAKKVVKDVQEWNKDEFFPNSYAIITLSLTAWGLGQVFAPDSLLNLLVKHVDGPEVELMGRLFGCSLATLLPTVAYSLQEVAKDVKIKQLPARSLNASLAVTAVLNIAVFLPYLTHGRGEVLMGPYLLLWAATLTTSLKYGLVSGKT